MEVTAATVPGLAAALGIGLLIGIERERRKGQGAFRSAAGVRTHALLSLGGAVAVLLDSRLLVVAGVLVAALAELHAAAATVTQLTATGGLSLESGRWGIVGLLLASGVVKSLVAFTSGGRGYGLRVTIGLLGSVVVAALVMGFTPP